VDVPRCRAGQRRITIERVQDRNAPSAGPTRITIEFDTTDPVSGRVLGAGGMADRFGGWLDLLTLLQSVNTEYGGTAERAR
jgi:hypothetical protein